MCEQERSSQQTILNELLKRQSELEGTLKEEQKQHVESREKLVACEQERSSQQTILNELLKRQSELEGTLKEEQKQHVESREKLVACEQGLYDRNGLLENEVRTHQKTKEKLASCENQLNTVKADLQEQLRVQWVEFEERLETTKKGGSLNGRRRRLYSDKNSAEGTREFFWRQRCQKKVLLLF